MEFDAIVGTRCLSPKIFLVPEGTVVKDVMVSFPSFALFTRECISSR